jgi:hypothetical protein
MQAQAEQPAADERPTLQLLAHTQSQFLPVEILETEGEEDEQGGRGVLVS